LSGGARQTAATAVSRIILRINAERLLLLLFLAALDRALGEAALAPFLLLGACPIGGERCAKRRCQHAAAQPAQHMAAGE
jgi:hypothetical protein